MPTWGEIMSLQPKSVYTPQEYLAIERNSQQKNEYFNGEIFAMGGASERHNLIVGNVFATLHTQLRGKPCKVYSSDMRVKVSRTGLYTYPDIVALCDEAQFDDEQQDTLVNPTVIIEVLSKSTEGYDRGEKFTQYRKIDSLIEYVLIAQDKQRIEPFRRQPDNQWLILPEISEPQEKLNLLSIQCTLLVADVY